MEKLRLKEAIIKEASKKNLSTIKEQLEDQKNIIEIADLLLENKFVFVRTWDMEPCHIPYEINPIDWLANPNGDPEWTFMLNRFDYLEYLAVGTILRGEEKYLRHAKNLILDWIESHPEILKDDSTRTLDTGMRIDSWINLLPYLEKFNFLTSREYGKIEESIIKQILYMKEEYIPKYTLSNWGSIQTSSMIRVLPMIGEFGQKEEIYEWATDEFERQIRLQVYDDGLHWEQSTMYHAEVMHYSMKLVGLESYQMPEDVKESLYKMAEALLYQMTPTGSFEAFGDSDISNLLSLLNLSAVIFKEEKFKVNNQKITNMDNLYEMSEEELSIYNRLSSHLPDELNFDGYDSGMFTSRTSWGKEANFTLFTNGTMGSGHAHADNNHLSIYHEGKGLIIDSGRYTYREDDERRIELKSAESHSSVVVDDMAGSIANGSWTFERYLKPMANRVKHKGAFHFYQGSTLSTKSPQFYSHTRKVLVADAGIWFIFDDVRAEGEHSLKSFFNIEPTVDIEKVDDELFLNELKFISLDESFHLNDHIYSPTYNVLEDNKQIELNSTFTDQSLTTKIFMNKDYDYEKVDILRDKKEAISDDLGIAVKVTLNAEYSITLVLIHEELYDGRKNLYCEGICFHAKALVIEEKKNNKEIYVLST